MKVLLAMDDSKLAEAAERFVLDHFDPNSTEIRLVNVVEPVAVSVPPQMSPGYFPELEDQVRQARQFVSRASSTLNGHHFRVTSTVAEGFAKDIIIDEAQEWHADLIVLGSHGRKGLDRLLLGSVSEAVMRHAPCSVLIVRSKE